MALELEHNRKRDRLYVTTAKPGHVSVYDVSDPQKPKFLKPYPSGEMEAYPVSTKVNKPTNDGPECIEPLR